MPIKAPTVYDLGPSLAMVIDKSRDQMSDRITLVVASPGLASRAVTISKAEARLMIEALMGHFPEGLYQAPRYNVSDPGDRSDGSFRRML